MSGDSRVGQPPTRPDGKVWPNLDGFLELAANRRVIPVVRRLLVDGSTPLALYQRLAGNRPGTFLLESAELDGSWSRYSFIGVNSAAMLTEVDGRAAWLGNVPVGMPSSDDPLAALDLCLQTLATPATAGLPPLTSGMVGMIGYDAIRRWEAIPDSNPGEVPVPELAMLLATDLAVLDHADGSVWLIANAINFDASDERAEQAHADAVARLDAMTRALASGTTLPPISIPTDPGQQDLTQRTSSSDYLASVQRAKEHIRAGDAFQIVVSQRFDVSTQIDAFAVYRVLRATNPSPYMYLFRFADPSDPDTPSFDVVGSSPEALVKVTDGKAMMHPIAGTRPRGQTPKRDNELAEELLGDLKERAEHLMLVDLGRNDLGRVCAPGSVSVVDFMTVERYSHVMHIVSTVTGDLSTGASAFDALAATFPAGTLSGAPKHRAMEIIDDLEPVRRGLYGGVVGYLDFAGNLDTAIAIRTAVLAAGRAYVQAGAGIVADSNPQAEDQECHNKAAAVLRAIALAESLQRPAT